MKNIDVVQSECVLCPFTKEMKDDMCYICNTQQIIRGKWKLVILWVLRKGPKRFSQLQREIPNVKQGPLTAQLKQLVASDLIYRKSYNQVPPRVEYGLKPNGIEFLKVMDAMDAWAKKFLFD